MVIFSPNVLSFEVKKKYVFFVISLLGQIYIYLDLIKINTVMTFIRNRYFLKVNSNENYTTLVS